jgi:hypothetical protein
MRLMDLVSPETETQKVLSIEVIRGIAKKNKLRATTHNASSPAFQTTCREVPSSK